MTALPDLDAIVLAGGRGERMGGREKAFLRLGSTTFIEHILATLAPLVREVIVTTNAPALYGRLPGVRLVPDERPGQGPLMGLYSGLKASAASWCFVTGVDAPLLQASLVRFLADQAYDCDAVVPAWEKGPEPLCALYARSCLSAIEQSIPRGRVISFYPLVRVRIVPQQSVRAADPAGHSFLNVNTAEDYERLRTMLLSRPAAQSVEGLPPQA